MTAELADTSPSNESSKVAIICYRFPGEKRWTGQVLTLPECMAEGDSQEQVSQLLEESLQEVLDRYPETRERVEIKPEYWVGEISVTIPKNL